ncbi:ArgS-related anticodon-binding protein NrtL [Streptomyces sp. CRN 30]|uniref:ArgS-related anticodon-binding protein NrtL n=1 Tax=Streptomyces sp. CRN 30 TaxID=3075613 RepID=UPI002A82E83B|nr:DALR anticodon-binding domain-containing protein [Streptomyces sp. CRN 30]
MTPVELSRTLLYAVRRAVDDGKLHVSVPERVAVTAPGPGGCGDYASNLALQLARSAGQPPRAVADTLRGYLLDTDGIVDVVITGPGFLNLSLGASAHGALVADVLRHGSRYGHAGSRYGYAAARDQPDDSQTVQLHCPRDLRALVVMDSVARLLRSRGARVRTTCQAPPPQAWTTVLDIHVDGIVDLDVTTRPVPVPDPDAVLRLGRDAGRWVLLHPAAHDHPHPEDGRYLRQTEDNPLFRVRYAHARTRALLRNAGDLGFTPQPGEIGTAAALVVETLLADHPRVLAAAARGRAPDRLARHLVALADATLVTLPDVLPLGDEKPSAAHRARLALAEAAGAVLAGGLSLLGIDAPDHL